MALTHRQEVISENIRDSIKENGSRAITGTILQQGMLQLNGCATPFNGEIIFNDTLGGQKLGMAELVNFLTGIGRLLGAWKTFMDEYYASDYPSGVYTAVYDYAVGNKVVGYISFWYLDTQSIKCQFLSNTYGDGDLYSFEVHGNNWSIYNVKKLSFV